jgi:flagellin
MNVKINGVAIGASSDDSAAAKAAAINAANAGVTATARTEVRIDVDLVAGAGDADDAAIGGITVDLDDASIQDLSDVVDAINTAMTGNNDIVASSNSDGELVLVSASGQNIVFDDGSENGGLFTAAVGDDGVANASLNQGVGTAFGILTLTSDDGGQITLSDGEGPTHTGLDTLGLQAQSEKVEETTTGLDVGSVANATAAMTAIDTAIETVSSFRAGFGATENRLDKAINNLTTYKVNLEAAKGRIEDADFASETAALTKSQILNQAATSMLAQANASKQNLLALLQ